MALGHGDVFLCVKAVIQKLDEIGRFAVEKGPVQSAAEGGQQVVRVRVQVFADRLKAFIGAAQVAQAVVLGRQYGEQLFFVVGVVGPQATVHVTAG